MTPRFTPVPQLLLALPMTVAATWRRHHLELAGIGWIVAGRVPGSVLGAWVLTAVAGRTLDLIIASVVLVAVGLLASGWQLRPARATRLIAGLASGFTGTTSAIGGPPLALLYARAPGGVLRSSLGAIFAIGVVINLVSLGATGVITSDDYRVTLLLLPPLASGYLPSSPLTKRIEGTTMRRAVLVVTAVAALGLGAKSVAA